MSFSDNVPRKPKNIYEVNLLIRAMEKKQREEREKNGFVKGGQRGRHQQKPAFVKQFIEDVKNTATGKIREEDLTDEQYRMRAWSLVTCLFRDDAMRNDEDTDMSDSIVPDVSFAWVNNSTVERPMPSSSREIAEFSERTTDGDQRTDLDADVLEKAGHFHNYLQQYNNLTLEMDFAKFPVEINHRMANLRPVFIDGCAVAKMFAPQFHVSWNDPHGALATLGKNKVLPIRPLVLAALRFTLMGHKAIILLPKYYEEPIFANIRQKVDDLRNFAKLRETGLIRFVEESASARYLQTMLKETKKDDGIYVSNAALQKAINRGARRDGNISAELEAEAAELTEEERNDARDVTISVYFMGRQRKLMIPLHISRMIEEGRGRRNRQEWRGREDILYFPPTSPRAVTDPLQITVGQQMFIINSLRDLYDLPKADVRAIEILNEGTR